MDSDNTVVNLATIAIPLPTDTHGLSTALGRTRLVDATDRLGMSMIAGHDLLAPIPQPLFIPLNRLQKSL